MNVGICNKCGENDELILAGCVCRSCSDRLDNLWASSKACDWVLTATFAPPVTDIMEALRRTLEIKKRTVGVKNDIEAKKENDDGWVVTEPGEYIHRQTTYAQIKTLWAMSDPPRLHIGADALKVRRATDEKTAHIMRSFTAKWHAASSSSFAVPKRSDIPLIRPATAEEVAKYDDSRRVKEGWEEIYRIAENWGFDDVWAPLDSRWDESTSQPAGQSQADWAFRRAIEEIQKRLEQLGLLGYSEFEVYRPKASKRSAINDEGLRAVDKSTRAEVLNPGHERRGLAQVVGMVELKEQLIHEVIGPFTNPELYRRYRVSLPNGILFFGPPGCGKTYIARALAEELGWFFQYCRPSDVASPYIHDTVTRIRGLFSTAIEKAPSILFIDEFEAFVPARSELGGHQQFKAEEVNEFLANLEGCAERKVLVIAATNEPEKIDPAVRRSGRFDKLILIPPPDAEARRSMLEFHLAGRPKEASLDTANIAGMLEGYSASDIKLLVDEAARMALKRGEPISRSTLLPAIERIPASITTDDVRRYAGFRSRGS